MPLSLRYIEETDVLASVTYCGVSGGAAVSAWRYRRCVRVVRLAAHVRGNDSALTATVLCRRAVLPAAALLGSSAGEAAATASSAAGGSRRRQC